MTYHRPLVWPRGLNWLRNILVVFGALDLPALSPEQMLAQQRTATELELLDALLVMEDAISEVGKLQSRLARMSESQGTYVPDVPKA